MKHYLIEVEPDERTRVMLTDEQLCRNLEIIVGEFFQIWTSGPEPAVTCEQLEIAAFDPAPWFRVKKP